MGNTTKTAKTAKPTLADIRPDIIRDLQRRQSYAFLSMEAEILSILEEMLQKKTNESECKNMIFLCLGLTTTYSGGRNDMRRILERAFHQLMRQKPLKIEHVIWEIKQIKNRRGGYNQQLFRIKCVASFERSIIVQYSQKEANINLRWVVPGEEIKCVENLSGVLSKPLCNLKCSARFNTLKCSFTPASMGPGWITYLCNGHSGFYTKRIITYDTGNVSPLVFKYYYTRKKTITILVAVNGHYSPHLFSHIRPKEFQILPFICLTGPHSHTTQSNVFADVLAINVENRHPKQSTSRSNGNDDSSIFMSAFTACVFAGFRIQPETLFAQHEKNIAEAIYQHIANNYGEDCAYIANKLYSPSAGWV